MTTLSTVPARTLPNQTARLQFTLTESASGTPANWVRVWVTTAPEGSEWRGELDAIEGDRVLVYEGNGGVGNKLVTTFAVGGKYTLKAQEYVKGTGYGGGYEGSPDTYETETEAGSEATLTLYVGERLSLTLGYGEDTALLILYVFNDTITATTPSDGELSPAVEEGSAETPKAQIAADSAAAAIAELDGVATSTAIGNPSTALNDILSKYNTHRASAVFHNSADTDNTVSVAYTNPTTPTGMSAAINECQRRLDLHMRNARYSNSTPTNLETGSMTYHVVGGNNRADLANMISAPASDASSIVSIMVLIADYWRAYEAHRINTSVHNASDTTGLTALSPLLDVLHDFNAALHDESPAAPPTAQTGVVKLVNNFGFEEAPL